MLDGTIEAHDAAYALSVIATGLGPLTVPRRDDTPGTAVRVQISARDVSLGLTAQESSSILNELPLVIRDLTDLSDADCLVRLGIPDDDQHVLLARITRKSRAQLQLHPGIRVFARVKSVAVLD